MMGIRISKHIGLFLPSQEIPETLKEQLEELHEDEDKIDLAFQKTLSHPSFNTPYYCGNLAVEKINGYQCFRAVNNVDDEEGIFISTPFQQSLSRHDCTPENYIIPNCNFTVQNIPSLPYFSENETGFEMSSEMDFFTTFLQNLELPLNLIDKAKFSIIYTFG